MNLSTNIPIADALGWTAALLTLTTFACADMRRLRLLALAANAAFIAYGITAGLLPVLALHLVLVPVNLWRLHQTPRAGAPVVNASQGDGETEPRRPEESRRVRLAGDLPKVEATPT
jgi:CRP/FNR family cyclic AMP-dependent transcriptional regulator